MVTKRTFQSARVHFSQHHVPLRHTMVSLPEAIHLNFFDAARVKGCHAAVKASSGVENVSVLKCRKTYSFAGD